MPDDHLDRHNDSKIPNTKTDGHAIDETVQNLIGNSHTECRLPVKLSAKNGAEPVHFVAQGGIVLGAHNPDASDLGHSGVAFTKEDIADPPNGEGDDQKTEQNLDNPGTGLFAKGLKHL